MPARDCKRETIPQPARHLGRGAARASNTKQKRRFSVQVAHFRMK
jgi:hypothetical protein